METIQIKTSQNIDIDYPVAGLGERIVAALIDYGMFFVIYILYIIIIASTGFNAKVLSLPILIIIFCLCYVFYDLLCEIFFNGQSLGKKIMKIKVISLNGAQATLGQYFLRWIFRIVDVSFTAGLGGVISVALSNNKQRIGDIVAGTTLIKTTPRTQFNHIAFKPVAQNYSPVFETATLLSDRDIELVHEVLNTYYTTGNTAIVYQMAAKIKLHIEVKIPEEMDELAFLKTVILDYNCLTSVAL
jgi:uncharacterized RDD family membrane protein YckC